MPLNGLLIGNSDGIGLATTKRLLDKGWKIIGVSRSDSVISNQNYHHHVSDVTDDGYTKMIADLVHGVNLDLCIYFAGIGELLDPYDMNSELKIFDVNLTGMVKTVTVVIPEMVKSGKGHFIGISSLADELLSAEAPSYHASKAGFSNYLEGLGLALKQKEINITNIRFGFVDTKMAKGEKKPFIMNVKKAVKHVEVCIDKKPIRYKAPRIAVPLIKFRKLMMKLGAS